MVSDFNSSGVSGCSRATDCDGILELLYSDPSIRDWVRRFKVGGGAGGGAAVQRKPSSP